MPRLISPARKAIRVPQVSFRANSDDATSDEQLLGQYRGAHSQEAFAALVERHGLMVIRVCRVILGNAADAEDMAQSVFLLLAREASSVRTNVAGWLYQTARSRSINELRSRRRRMHREELAAARTPSTLDEGGSDLVEELGIALKQLQTRLRQAVVLRYVEGRSVAEAAQAAGCPPGTMGRRTMEGLRQLRSILTRRVMGAVTALLGVFTAHTKLGIAAVVVATGVGLTLVPVKPEPVPGNVVLITSLAEIPEPNASLTRQHWPEGAKVERGYVVQQADETIASCLAGTTRAGEYIHVYLITRDGKPFYVAVNGARR